MGGWKIDQGFTVRVLVIEDDLAIARQVSETLRQFRYVVDVAHDGVEGQFLGETEAYDAVVLDLGLPRLDGLSVLRQWRQTGRAMPVLILTARDTWREKVAGLRAGADDYLAKPFELEEMLARVEALIRRSSGHASPVLECGPLTLDVSSSKLTVDGRPTELTALEFRTLAHLMRQEDRIVSKTELTEHLYDQDFDRDSNVREKGLEIQRTMPEDCWFRGEEQDLEEMLGNLIDNACKWAESKVQVHARCANDRLLIMVEDDGPGIPEQRKSEVLGRGCRLDENVRGSGLGLDIVQDIVGIYRGSISLNQGPHGGLSVHLDLPSAT